MREELQVGILSCTRTHRAKSDTHSAGLITAIFGVMPIKECIAVMIRADRTSGGAVMFTRLMITTATVCVCCGTSAFGQSAETERSAREAFVAVMGQVARPGVYAVSNESNSLAALMKQTGGLTKASTGGLTVIRNQRLAQRVYWSQQETPAVELLPGDIVYADGQAHSQRGADVQVALIGLGPNPHVIPVPSNRADIESIVAYLGQHSKLTDAVRILPVGRRRTLRTVRADLAVIPSSAAVLYFPTEQVNPHKLPPLPPAFQSAGEESDGRSAIQLSSHEAATDDESDIRPLPLRRLEAPAEMTEPDMIARIRQAEAAPEPKAKQDAVAVPLATPEKQSTTTRTPESSFFTDQLTAGLIVVLIVVAVQTFVQRFSRGRKPEAAQAASTRPAARVEAQDSQPNKPAPVEAEQESAPTPIKPAGDEPTILPMTPPVEIKEKPATLFERVLLRMAEESANGTEKKSA